MGLIDRVIGGGGAVQGIGAAAEGLSEVFVPNATRAQELAADIHQATLQTAAAEFEHAGTGWFDRMINGLNRLPRPMLALGTLGLFGYAMTDPSGFATRMVGLQEVPEPLWWLLGAIVSFYFGARELHYARSPGGRDAGGSGGLRARLGGMFRRRAPAEAPAATATAPRPEIQAATIAEDVASGPENPALREWRSAS